MNKYKVNIQKSLTEKKYFQKNLHAHTTVSY